MTEEPTSSTFGGWADRITWLLAEGQLLLLGLMFTAGGVLLIYRPSLPTVPPIVVGWLAAGMLFGPPLFAFFVTFVRRLRDRRMVEVHHVNAAGDTLQKFYVEPEIWAEKSVDGANPYPVNGGGGWAVREFDYDEDMGELRVKGVWLSECQDTKLLTSKSHMRAIYGKLTESHITLNVMRDSVSELGADIQGRVVTAGAEAREKGTMMDPTAVKDVFESFEEDISGTDEGDLPTLKMDEIAEKYGVETEPGETEAETSPEAPADD